jgi:putative transposase
VVFSTKGRKPLIHGTWKTRLYDYITATVQRKGQKMLAINGVADHIHLLIGQRPNCCLSDLVKDVKLSSADFIRRNHLSTPYFQWQNGFGAFSYSPSHVNAVVKYIANQEEHHRTRTFEMEIRDILDMLEVEYHDRDLLEWFDEADEQ